MIKRSNFVRAAVISFLLLFLFLVKTNAAESIEPLSFEDTNSTHATDLNNDQVQEHDEAIPLRLCVFPNETYWPKGLSVWGINLGVPVSFSGLRSEEIYGLDLGLISSMSDNVKGLQASIFTKSSKSTGGQIAIVNMSDEFTGLQGAVVNKMVNSDSVQIGIVNISRKSNGLQLGLINIMENGFLPVFPIINFSM